MKRKIEYEDTDVEPMLTEALGDACDRMHITLGQPLVNKLGAYMRAYYTDWAEENRHICEVPDAP